MLSDSQRCQRRLGLRSRVAAIWLVPVLGLTGCSSGDPILDTAPTTTQPGATASAEATAEAETGALEVVVGDGESEQPAKESRQPTEEATAAADPVAAADEPPADVESESTTEPATPAETAWVLVLAGASDPYDPILTDTLSEVGDLGYESRISNCDQGAAEAIGMAPEGTFTLSALFGSEAAAVEASAVLASSQIEGLVTEVVVACPE